MKMLPPTQLANAPLTTLMVVSDRPPKHLVTEDPQIDTGGQNIVFLGVVLLAVMVVIVMGILSPKIEHAIIAAIGLSFGLIGFFLLLGH